MKKTILSLLGHKQKAVNYYDSDWEYQKSRWRESDILETLDKQGIEKYDSALVVNEMNRRQRTEQLIEMGKSYQSPTAARYPERDGPDLDRD